MPQPTGPRIRNRHGQVIYDFPLTMRVEGLPKEREVPSLRIDGREGEIVNPDLIQEKPRTISVVGKLYGRGCTTATQKADLEKRIDDLMAAIGRKEEVWLSRSSTDTRYLPVYYTGVTPSYVEGTGRTVAVVRIQFRCFDPHWYALTESVVNTLYCGPGFRVEAENPNTPAGAAGRVKVEYRGNGWSKVTDATASGGAYYYTNVVGNYVVVAFYGTGMIPTMHHTASAKVVGVALDGVALADHVVVGDSSGFRPEIIQGLSGLPARYHEVVLTFKSGTSIHIDCFDIIGSEQLTIDNTGSDQSNPVIYVEAQDRVFSTDFLGKVVGSLVENRNDVKRGAEDVDVPPRGSGLVDPNQAAMDLLMRVDNGTTTYFTVTGGKFPQYLFSYDLTAPLSSVALDKIRDHLRGLTFRWVGYSKSPWGGAVSNRSYLKAWNNVTQRYDTLAEMGVDFRSATNIPVFEAGVFSGSSAVRIADGENLDVPLPGVIHEDGGTIRIWFNDNGNAVGKFVWDTNRADSTRVHLFRTADRKLRFFYTGSSFVAESGVLSVGYHLATVTWKGTVGQLLVDGVLAGSLDSGVDLGARLASATALTVGRRYTDSHYLNSLVDSIQILHKAVSEAEEAAYFASGVPFTHDANTTLLLEFDGSLDGVVPYEHAITSNPASYVDDEGKVHFLVRPKYASDGVTASSIWVDYVSLDVKHGYAKLGAGAIVNQGRNLLANPGFEEGDTDPLGWEKFGSPSWRRVKVSSGERSVLVDTDNFYYQLVPVVPGGVYRWSGNVAADQELPTVLWFLDFRSPGDTATVGQNIVETVFVSTSFARVSKTVQAPENAAYARVYARTTSTSSPPVRRVYIDDVQFELVDSLGARPSEYTDDLHQTIDLGDIELGHGDILQLDTARIAAEKNGVSIIGSVGDDYQMNGFRLLPGRNTIQITDQGDKLLRVVMKYRERWL